MLIHYLLHIYKMLQLGICIPFTVKLLFYDFNLMGCSLFIIYLFIELEILRKKYYGKKYEKQQQTN